MSHPALTFETNASSIEPGDLVLVSVNGREALSTLYEYDLVLETTKEGGLPMDTIQALLSEPCFIHMSETESVEIHGMIRELKLFGGSESSPILYGAKLVPMLWQTTRSFRSRVYQEVTVKDVVTQVLELSGIEPEWRLAKDYPKSEYVVQYEESDFAFMSRMLEHWGIYYYFKQAPDGEVLIIADNNKQFKPLEGAEVLTYNPQRSRSNVHGTVQSIDCTYAPQASGLVLREYNWQTPSTPLMEKDMVDEDAGFGLQCYYGEHFKDADQGKKLVEIRKEQMLIERELFEGTCSVTGLAPGHTFELTACPVSDLNFEYLVTSVEPVISTVGDATDEAVEYRFTAVPFKRDTPEPVEYRSQRLTETPKIFGFMHGFVDGEVASTAAPIDKLGRYRIVLPLDTVAEPGGKATRWIRMAQASSGASYGIHFPLHIGTEVAIIHLDGDPDRPVIMGSVPNTETVSPVVDGNATQSQIRTRSGIVFEFEDDA